MATNDKPIEVFKAGGVQASVFLNKVKVNGQTRDIPSIVFQKRYKAKDSGEWKSTNRLDASDLPKALWALFSAYDLTMTLREEEQDEQEQEPEPTEE